MSANLRIGLVGQVSVTGTSGSTETISGRQPQTLLAMLALEGGSVGAETVAEVFWGDTPSPHWRGALRGVVSKVRTALVAVGAPEDALEFKHGVIRLHASIGTNIARVETLTAAARDRRLDDAELDELRTSVVALRHPFLVHDDSVWADAQRFRIAALLDDAEHAVLDQLRRSGSDVEAMRWAEAVVARDPVDTQTRIALVELYLDDGNMSAARAAFIDLERVLGAEFDADPDPELRARVQLHASPFDLATLAPRPRHPDAREPFVGRHDALGAVESVWQRVIATGIPEIVLVRGPAGIGKTRFADRIAGLLGAERQLWGRCRAESGPSWGPVADAFGDLLRGDVGLAHRITVDFPDIELLAPVHHGPEESRPRPAVGDPRDAAMTVTADLISEIAREPTVCVLDDLQWIRADGVTAIETILDGVRGRLLIVATCREVPDVLTGLLESAARQDRLTELGLDRFTLPELADLASARAADRPLSDAEIAAVHDRSGGLPYFACALLRESDVDVDGHVPDTVATWLDQVLRTLSDGQRRLLEVLAVLGTRADLPAIEAVSAELPFDVADTLDELERIGLAVVADDGQVRIPHDLTQWAMWRSIGTARRAMLHRRAGDHLEQRGAPAAVLALHWSSAGTARRRAADRAALTAGQDAMDIGAWSAALAHFDGVRSRAEDPGTQCRALLGIGRASMQLHDYATARAALEAAVDLSVHHGLDLVEAEATLLLVGRAGRGAILDDEEAQLSRLQSVYRRLGAAEDRHDGDRWPVLMARIEAELAISLLFTAELDERQRLLTSALTRMKVATGAEPVDVAAAILAQRMGRIEAGQTTIRLAEVDEVLAMPHARLDAEILAAAHTYRYEELLRLGRRNDATAALAEAERIADRSRLSYWQWAIATWNALDTLLDGNLDEAEARFGAAVLRRPAVAEALACQQVNLVGLRLLQGRADELSAALIPMVETYPHIPTWRAALALSSSEAGDLERAGELLEFFDRDDYRALPMDTNRFFALGILAHVAADVGDSDAAGRLWELLVPYRGELVLLNCYGGGGACWGPVDFALARLAPLRGEDGPIVADLWRDAGRFAPVMPAMVDRIDRAAHEAGFATVAGTPVDDGRPTGPESA